MIEFIAKKLFIHEDDSCQLSLLDRLKELTGELVGEPEGNLPQEVQEWVDKKNDQ